MSESYRPLTLADLPTIRPIEDACYSHPWSDGNFADSLAAGYSAWRLDIDGVCVGYSVTMPVLDEVHILNLTVAPAARRRGLGRDLLARALARAVEVGAASAYLEVRVSNTAAIALYRSAGFEDIAQRRDYYPAHDGREDALIFRKVLL